MKKSGGYILISRELFKNPRLKPRGVFTDFEAWIWMINEAAFKSREIEILSGRSRKIIWIERGQFSHSVRFLADKWGWSINRVRRFLADLRTDTAIDTQTDTGQMLISLVNYEAYQDPHSVTDTQTDTQSHKQTDTKKKESKKEGYIARPKTVVASDGFPEWYSVYPKKKSRTDAEKAYGKIIAGGKITHGELLDRTLTFAAGWAARIVKEGNAAMQFIPYPASWLNDGGFNDEDLKFGAPKPSGPAPVKAAADFSEADWRDCLAFQRKHGKWSHSEWGAPPGSPGCLVPSHLLLNRVSVAGSFA